MSATPRLRELDQALADLPRTLVGEVLFGRLVTQPRPSVVHSVAASALGAALIPPFGQGVSGPGGWIILDEPELQLGPHVVVPDLAGWRRETMPEIADVARCAVVPDWVCEVLSPSTEAIDRDEKMTIYGANGVGHLWLVDVRAKRIETYRSERGRFRASGTYEGETVARIEPFDAIELPMSWLWSR